MKLYQCAPESVKFAFVSFETKIKSLDRILIKFTTCFILIPLQVFTINSLPSLLDK